MRRWGALERVPFGLCSWAPGRRRRLCSLLWERIWEQPLTRAVTGSSCCSRLLLLPAQYTWQRLGCPHLLPRSEALCPYGHQAQKRECYCAGESAVEQSCPLPLRQRCDCCTVSFTSSHTGHSGPSLHVCPPYIRGPPFGDAWTRGSGLPRRRGENVS